VKRESDTDDPIRYDRAGGDVARKKRRALYIALTSVVSIVVLAAVLEATGVLDLYGIDTATVSAPGGGGEMLDVRYAKVTRGQLVVPLEIAVTSPQGFSDDIVLSISSSYMDPFLTQGPTPQPSSSTADESQVVLTFDPPSGDTFTVRWNLTAEPVGKFTTAHGSVSLLGGDRPTATVGFNTEIRP